VQAVASVCKELIKKNDIQINIGKIKLSNKSSARGVEKLESGVRQNAKYIDWNYIRERHSFSIN